MDAIDESILSYLTVDARLSFRDLGHRVGLSANAAAARVRRLVGDGTIGGFTIRRGPDAQGPVRRGLEVFVDVRLGEGIDTTEAARAFADLGEVVDAVHVTGSYDYLVHAVTADAMSLDRLLRKLKERGAVQTSTRIALRSSSG